MIEGIITILFVIIGVAISVSLHELGHMIPAKLFKVPVSEYFIGFGPKIISKKIGETEYGVKAIWLGGYTKIVGMFPQPNPEVKKCRFGQMWDKVFFKIIDGVHSESTEGITRENTERVFYNLSAVKKIVIMLGGIATNFILGLVCFLIAFSLIGGSAPSTTIGSVLPNSPAEKSGLVAGDTIKFINNSAVESWVDVVDKIAATVSDAVIEVEDSDGRYREMIVTPDRNAKIGISSKLIPTHYTFAETVDLTLQTTQATMALIVTIPANLVKTVVQTVTLQPRTDGLISLVGLGQAAIGVEQVAPTMSAKIGGILSLIGSLNIGLFVLNLVPLLPLDGGHAVNAIYEGVSRRIAKIRKVERPFASDLARSMPIAYFVYGLLMLMAIILIIADIVNPVKFF